MPAKSRGITLISCRLGEPSAGFPPFGLMYLASYMRRNNISCEIKDFQADYGEALFFVDQLVDYILGSQFNIVGISIFSNSIPLVIKALGSPRLQKEDLILILGGPGVAAIEDDIATACPRLNHIVSGEGEIPLLKIVSSHLNREGEPKTVGSNGHSASTRVVALDDLPIPAWDLVDGARYSKTPLVTMRGCPFDCDFCDVKATWGKRVTFRSPENVMAEVEYIYRVLGRTHLRIVDDTLTVNRNHIKALCNLFIERRLPVTWTCFARIDTLDEAMMLMMSQAGCKGIYLGIESGDESILRDIRKPKLNETLLKRFSVALSLFRVTASFIWGFPMEEVSAFRESIDLAFALARLGHTSGGDINIQLHLLAPTVGSSLFEKFEPALFFSQDEPLSYLGGAPLNNFRGATEYDEIVQFIRDNKRLCAPFYCFQSEEFETKSALIRGRSIPQGSRMRIQERYRISQKLSFIYRTSAQFRARRMRRSSQNEVS
ncbi:radical SAM protein [Mesorhizobium sp.]|uniref:B12-binding domain-containing radical SAM protein n=1 Tax=Mesorhizobium sp. TaxID=1871066 RepID=UPI000FE9696A|nr:radical SAM protein [Mesorhizobium sp.]RWD70277.1 MAG: B12-binding domain-containing radical SAM protein [Mesorhizobium sp.]